MKPTLRFVPYMVAAVLATAASSAPLPPPAPAELLTAVDPFIGTNSGNTTPAACVPVGLVKLGPDSVVPNTTSGYKSGKPLIGFSHTHVNGTGGTGRYGNILVTPQTGPLSLDAAGSPATAEQAAPGYYAVTLERWGVRAELTTTGRAGFHRYTFPVGQPARILIDAGATIDLGRNVPSDGTVHFSRVQIVGDRRIEGRGDFSGGWGGLMPYEVYFVAEFSAPFSASGVWADGKAEPGLDQAQGRRAGAYAEFSSLPDGVVELRVGISVKSLARAHSNLEQAPAHTFAQSRAYADAAWIPLLSTLRFEGATPSERRALYSSFYRCFLMPTDIGAGENPAWDSPEPHYWDYYCIWDTFRSLNPLLTLVAPDRQRDIVRSLVDIAAHTGWMPDAWISGDHAAIQGGSNGDVVIADAIVKGLDGIDYAKALDSMIRTATTPSPRPCQLGRYDTADYERLGYVPDGTRHNVSRTLEYAYDDFCIARVARTLGRTADADRFARRAQFTFNVFNPDTHFFWSRKADGTWRANFDPDAGTRWGQEGPFYEGFPWDYSTYAPHDMAGLIARHGGPAPFVEFLDRLFDGGHFYIGNEPSFLTPYAYLYAGRPDRVVDRVDSILATKFAPTREGLPGDDDAGAMASWYVFGMLGIFPVAGQDVYLISRPHLPRATLDLGGGKTFSILAKNLAPKNCYVQSARLNGAALDRAWFRHAELARGGELEITLGPAPSAWGTHEPPPSVSTAH